MCRRLQACQQALPGKGGAARGWPAREDPIGSFGDARCRRRPRKSGAGRVSPSRAAQASAQIWAPGALRRPSSVSGEGTRQRWWRRRAPDTCGARQKLRAVRASFGPGASQPQRCWGAAAFYVDLRSACGFCAGARYNLGQMASKSVTKKLLCMQCEEELPRSHYKTTQWELRANRTCRKFQGAPTAQPVDVNLVLSQCRSRRVNLVLSDVPCAHGAGRQWGWGCSDDPSRCDIYIYIYI